MPLLRRAEHSLDPSERRVAKIRHHWITMAPVVAGTIAAIAVLAIMSSWLPVTTNSWLPQTLIWYVEIAALCWYAWHLLHWYHNVIIITDKRFMRVRGIIRSLVEVVPVKKVTDYELEESLLGKALGYATFRLESAGKDSLKQMTYIPDPNAIEEIISKLVLGEDLPPHRDEGSTRGYSADQETIEDYSRHWPELENSDD